jgi:hypothetical protein
MTTRLRMLPWRPADHRARDSSRFSGSVRDALRPEAGFAGREAMHAIAGELR